MIDIRKDLACAESMDEGVSLVVLRRQPGKWTHDLHCDAPRKGQVPKEP